MVRVAPATLAELLGLGERTERLGHGLKTRASAGVADSGVWRGDGDRSPEEWLARQTGTSKADAGRPVEIGRQPEAIAGAVQAQRRRRQPRAEQPPFPDTG